ncbi:hypothetical protein [Paenibacillus lemnae]|uniref:Uncharacterized protein n=1 Tax=Paenibacillus lemnae TaxID=1330551 RepID=A0A848M8I0_PAELE|nr:hypothetical protein [Paenibacillus lemnae]NMO95814.1 hypothetical protein [Paenibacillus lemnae]
MSKRNDKNLITFPTISGCSKHHKSLFIGSWKAVQASQPVEGSNEELIQFNHLSVTFSDLTFQKLHEETGKESAIVDAEKKVEYEWKSNDQILIDNKLFTGYT